MAKLPYQKCIKCGTQQRFADLPKKIVGFHCPECVEFAGYEEGILSGEEENLAWKEIREV